MLPHLSKVIVFFSVTFYSMIFDQPFRQLLPLSSLYGSSQWLSIAEDLRKIYGDWTLNLIIKFEKANIKHRKALLDLQFLKNCETIMSFQSIYALKLLVLICALLPHIGDVSKHFCGKRLTAKILLLVNLTKTLNCCIII